MPKEKLKPCCGKCYWFKLEDDDVWGELDEGGWCTRFPQWRNNPVEAYCGEFITPKAWNRRAK